MGSEFHVNGRALQQGLIASLTAIALLVAGFVTPFGSAHAVVGGVPTTIDSNPWQAMIVVRADNRLCGGSIIDRSWIVTAAHCVAGFTPGQVGVHVGISELSQRSTTNEVAVADVIVHPSWDADRFRNDIALLRLQAPVSTGPTIQTVALPVGIDGAQWPASGTPARITGWGSTSYDAPASNVLRSGNVQVLGGPAETDCGEYGGNFDASVEICAGVPDGSVDACQGDSGSPLIVDVTGTAVLAGLTSVGFECARVGYPGIYTRTSTFLSWIQQYVPAIASAPAAPQNVTVTAIAGERVLVEWQPPILPLGSALTGYRAELEPGDGLCEVPVPQGSCVIENVPAGKMYSVTAVSLYASGARMPADAVQAVSVDGVTSAGKRVRSKRLARWADLKVRKTDVIRLAVRPASRDVCTRWGKRKKPRGVRADESGLCAVRVTVIRPNGKKKRAVAYVRVR